MNLNKKKYLKHRREVVVKFVDDNDVFLVQDADKVRNDKSQNEINQRPLKDPDQSSPSKTKKVGINAKKIIKDRLDYIEEDSSDNEEKITVAKPVALFQEGDVPGIAVFGFHTPKRKNAMSDKATESAEKLTPSSKLLTSSPKTPSSASKNYGFTPRARRSISLKLNSDSPRDSSCQIQKKKELDRDRKTDSCKKKKSTDEVQSKNTFAKTPYSLRARLKNKIAHVVRDNFGDFRDSGEDFVPSDVDNDDEDEDEESSQNDSDNSSESPLQPVRNSGKRETHNVLCDTPSQKRKRKDLTYAITADEYFNSNNGKKNKTSNHTLNRLKNPRLAQDQLDVLLNDIHQKSSHQSVLAALWKESSSEYLFKKWCFCLKEGFSILLYGLGSKRQILNTFHKKALSKSHVFVINGYFPGLTIKEIVDSLAGELLNIKDVTSQLHEVLESIEAKLNARGSPQVFIIVHNLDGVPLRSDKAQSLLARLASIKKCHIIASIDHINAPLLWDDTKLSEFNFMWEDVTNFNMYSEETSYENSLLVQRSSSLALASLKNVFQSLTKNGKEIFKILLEDCLANKKSQKYLGIGFSDLYWRCRDNFLVSTDLALRSQLTEFLDHQLVKWRKDSDHLHIPIDPSVLEQFQNILQDAEV